MLLVSKCKQNNEDYCELKISSLILLTHGHFFQKEDNFPDIYLIYLWKFEHNPWEFTSNLNLCKAASFPVCPEANPHSK